MTELFDPATLAQADDPSCYVERYRFSPLLVAGLGLMAAVGAASVVLAVVASTAFLAEPAPATGVATVASVLIAGASAVFVTRWILAAATHRVAFRADRHGITLGSQPYPPTRTVTVPWNDLAEIAIGWSLIPTTWSVVLTLRRDAPRPAGIPGPGTVRGAIRRVRIWWTYPVSGDMGRFVQGWTLDADRLRTTVTTHAPHASFRNLP